MYADITTGSLHLHLSCVVFEYYPQNKFTFGKRAAFYNDTANLSEILQRESLEGSKKILIICA